MDGMVGNVGGTNHVIELFSSKWQACRVSDSQSEFQSQFQSRIHFIHSFSHSLTHRPPPSPLASFVCARVFLSRKLSLGPDDQQPTDNRQPSTSCSFVSAYISLAYNFYLLLIQLQNCSLIAHISWEMKFITWRVYIASVQSSSSANPVFSCLLVSSPVCRIIIRLNWTQVELLGVEVEVGAGSREFLASADIFPQLHRHH